MRSAPLLLLAIAARAMAAAAPPRTFDPDPAATALGPVPAGKTELTVTAGLPFHSAAVDHGLGDRFDAGFAVEVAGTAFLRPKLQGRARMLAAGPVQLVVRGDAGMSLSSRYRRGANGELALGIELFPVRGFSTFAEMGGIFLTGFNYEHNAAFLDARGGIAYAPHSLLALFASAGTLRGALGARMTGSASAKIRF